VTIGKAQDIIDYTKAASAKYPEILDPASKKMYSPIADYIVKNGKLPSNAEISALSKKSSVFNEKTILYADAAKGLTEKLNDIAKDSENIQRLASISSSRAVIRQTSGLTSPGSRSLSTSGVGKRSLISSTRTLPSGRSSAGAGVSVPSLLSGITQDMRWISQKYSNPSSRSSKGSVSPVSGYSSGGSPAQSRKQGMPSKTSQNSKGSPKSSLPSTGSPGSKPASISTVSSGSPGSRSGSPSSKSPSPGSRSSSPGSKPVSPGSNSPSPGSQSGKNGSSWHDYYKKKKVIPPLTAKKENGMRDKSVQDFMRTHRLIKNQLANLETLVG
jgi:hypothetical protein